MVGRARRVPFLVDIRRFDRYDLAFEVALGPRPLRPFLRRQTESVGVGAGDTPLVGDALRALELRRLLVQIAVPLRDRTSEVGARGRAERHAAHRFHATRERRVDDARFHEGRGEVRRLLRRTTLTVDGRRRDFERQPGEQPCGARDVEGLFANLAHAPADDLTNLEGIDARPRDHGLLGRGEELGWMHGREASVAAPERRSRRLDDDNVLIGECCHAVPHSSKRLDGQFEDWLDG
jgi:hypothetical protein